MLHHRCFTCLDAGPHGGCERVWGASPFALLCTCCVRTSSDIHKIARLSVAIANKISTSVSQPFAFCLIRFVFSRYSRLQCAADTVLTNIAEQKSLQTWFFMVYYDYDFTAPFHFMRWTLVRQMEDAHDSEKKEIIFIPKKMANIDANHFNFISFSSPALRRCPVKET